eukprot:1182709-Prorocentrum_minimum.AAC.1
MSSTGNLRTGINYLRANQGPVFYRLQSSFLGYSITVDEILAAPESECGITVPYDFRPTVDRWIDRRDRPRPYIDSEIVSEKKCLSRSLF